MRKALLPTLGAGALVAVALVAVLTGCGATPEAAPSTAPASSSPTEPATPAMREAAPPAADPVVGTIVRFTSDRTTVDVTIGEDNPTARDFLSLLPVEVAVEELSGREKIAYFSRKLTTEGSPGSDPENGDLIYFSPWGNIGFYYDGDGIEYSDATIHLGTYSATPEQLALLEGGPVSIAIVDG